MPESAHARVLATLRRQLEAVSSRSSFYAELFNEHGIAPPALERLTGLRRLPFTTKAMLRESQAAAPPLGRHAAASMSEVVRVHASTGTTGTPSWVGVTRADSEAWTEMTAAAMRTQGLTSEDVVVHGAGLTLFVGGLPVRDAIERVGATMVPIGTGASEKAVLAMDTLGVTTLHSTPSYARYLAGYIRTRAGRDPREFGVAKIMVGGEPGGGEPALREHLAKEWGATITEGLGNADIAPIVFAEEPGTEGMRLTGGEHVLPELVDPDSGEPVDPEPGTTGELVYTSLTRECCPLVRFRTRDRVRITGMAPDGAPLLRCVGRTDDMLIVLGVNVFPSAVRDLVQTFSPRTSGEMRVVLHGEGPRVEPPLRVEAEWGDEPGDHDELRQSLQARIKNQLSVPAEVTLVPPGSMERSEMKTRLTRTEART